MKFPRTPLSLTARLALLFAMLAAVLLMVVGMALEHAVEAHFEELDHQDLASKLTVISRVLARITSEEDLNRLPQRLEDALAGHDLVAVLVRDEGGSGIYAARAARFAPAQLAGVPLSETARNWKREGHQYIGREATLLIPLPEPLPVRVLIGLDISHHAHFLTSVRNRLWIGISAAVLAAALLGWFAARKGLAPLRRVTAAARRLSTERLGERLSESDAPAEMLALVEAFNGMLDRLEAAFLRLSDFSADIAHELRTPVSNLMTETQVALSRSRSADEYRETLHSNLEELDRLARMIADMLFLAKADNGLLPRPVETVALETEVRALMEFYEALAEEEGIHLSLTGTATVTGDRLMLRRALSNLIANALRHTPAGGQVTLQIEREGDKTRLLVCNPGDTIPPEQLPRLFERFYRGDPSRVRQGESTGLGLAITRSIIEAHDGGIDVESANGVTTFRLHLPRSKASASSAGDNEPQGPRARDTQPITPR
ncbi:MAG: HAMP domain-containing protein [Candidatus Competibacteraceae bacterium]|nr:MAG: HAMP domain-containing protein [Candidatus Competibacteraceae bacterium]